MGFLLQNITIIGLEIETTTTSPTALTHKSEWITRLYSSPRVVLPLTLCTDSPHRMMLQVFSVLIYNLWSRQHPSRLLLACLLPGVPRLPPSGPTALLSRTNHNAPTAHLDPFLLFNIIVIPPEMWSTCDHTS